MIIDLAFIQALKKGDENAYRMLRTICLQYALMYEKNRSDAEDIADIVRARISRTIIRYNPSAGRGNCESNFRTWVRTYVLNAFRDHLERTKRVQLLEMLANALDIESDKKDAQEQVVDLLDEIINQQPDESDSVKRRRLAAAIIRTKDYYAEALACLPLKHNPEWELAIKEVRSALAALPRRNDRALLCLKYMMNFTEVEISVMVGAKFAKVQTDINRARARARKFFSSRNIDGKYLDRKDWVSAGHVERLPWQQRKKTKKAGN